MKNIESTHGLDFDFLASKYNISILLVVEILTTAPVEYNELSRKICIPAFMFTEIVQDFVNLTDLVG